MSPRPVVFIIICIIALINPLSFAAAEKAEDFDSELLHYENIYDSTSTNDETRTDLRLKFQELRPKVAPNKDTSKAGVWKIKAYVFRNLDFTWKDKEGEEHKAAFAFSEDEVNAIRVAMDAFAKHVWNHSWGNLKIEYDLTVIEKPLNKLDGKDSFWPGPESCMPYFDDFTEGDADSIFVYVKIRDGEKKGKAIPPMLLGGTFGVLPSTKGATYIGFNSGGGWCTHPDGEVQWHEWLHAAQWAMESYQKYPTGLMVTSDGGRKEGESGGDLCFRRTESQKTWMPFYAHIMEEHVTRKMWRELSVTKKPGNPWIKKPVIEESQASPGS